MPETKSASLVPKKVDLSMPQTGVVNYPSLRRILEGLVKKLSGRKLHIDGAYEMVETPDGPVFRINPGSTDITFPWQCKVLSGSLWMAGGSYNDIALDPFELGTGSGYAWLQVTWNVTDIVSGQLMSATLDSAVVQKGSSVPASDPAAGIWYISLVQYATRKVLSQFRNLSLSAVVCYNGGTDGLGSHIIISG